MSFTKKASRNIALQLTLQKCSCHAPSIFTVLLPLSSKLVFLSALQGAQTKQKAVKHESECKVRLPVCVCVCVCAN